MNLHRSTFDYLTPTDAQKADMLALREAARTYARLLETYLPEGPDRSYCLRKLREVAMWANVAVTRFPHGAPRGEDETAISEGP